MTDWIGSGLDTVWSGAVSAWDWVWGNDPNARAQASDQQIMAAQVKDVTMLNRMYEGFRDRVSEMSAAWEPFKVSLGEGFESVYSVMQALGGHIQTVVIPAVKDLASSLRDVASGVEEVARAGGIDVKVPKSNPGGSFWTRGFAHAAGGIFSTPHIGVVAENHKKEAIVPLEDRARGIPLWMAAGREMGLSFGGGTTNNTSYTGGSPTINITVNGGGDEQSLAQRVAQAVREALRDIQSYEERVAFA